MITMQPMPPLPIEQVTELWQKDSNAEAFLSALRGNGFGKVDCIRALRQMSDISLREAKEIVHCSAVWADRRAADDDFHEAAYQALLQDGWVEEEVDEPAKFAISKSLTAHRS